ncbi:cell division protein FtsQ/DivIB [Amycolatopsis suaedae]|uniref:Cell division protein FtsQ n=1 Tax=Amycolatopsis suaedae TaxID=2510978 RepID=A0A4Q7J9V4_9PSEU|nr:FtsQ-type POTRA domain-containing protein [Amycolatopsis suaedae]RZQ63223.1 FtsQ-type POTRA domain-containing protein [Amycolatopsis suaedae]
MATVRERRRERSRTRPGRSGRTGTTRRGRRPDSARQRTGTRPSRRRALRRRWVAVLSVLAATGLVYLLLFTSLLGVRTVEVSGTVTVTPDQVRAAAQVPDRRAMLRLDTDEIRDRVLALPGVATADVSRSWPSTIEIAITERTPMGFYDTGKEIHLVDVTGTVFKQVQAKPEGLPELKLAKVGPDDPATRAVTDVFGRLPEALRKQVVVVEAKSPGSVELRLGDGKLIRWGDAQQSERKAKVLAALMTQPGQTYDVSSPELPTIS